MLRIAQPQFNHNAGALNFGPDGQLYIVLGDGGGADAQNGQIFQGQPIVGHGEIGNGQNPGTILGALLRIDPTGTNTPNEQYGIPEDNPFFVPQDGGPVGGQAGCMDGFCDEIFAYGFRNPFRFSFDMLTGLLFVGDVGQNNIEEVDLVVKGGNYGWRLKEGTFLFDPDRFSPGSGAVIKNAPGVPPGLIDPIAQFDHDEGVAVVGGFVYRGNAIPALQGRYIFGNFIRPPFQATDVVCNGRLFFLEEEIVRTPLTEVLVTNNLLTGRIVEVSARRPRGIGLGRLGLRAGRQRRGVRAGERDRHPLWRDGRGAAHRAALAARPTPPPCGLFFQPRLDAGQLRRKRLSGLGEASGIALFQPLAYPDRHRGVSPDSLKTLLRVSRIARMMAGHSLPHGAGVIALFPAA